MQYIRQGWRGRATAVLAALVAFFAILAGANPAFATDYRGQLNPNQALYSGESLWSPNGHYRLVQQHAGNCADGDRCAYALLTGAGPGDQVYMDRSSNGGGSWAGRLNTAKVANSGSWAYTGVLRDSKGLWVRACSPRSNGVYRCTGWF